MATFNEAGVITAADVHVATSVGRLGGETGETVLLAVALAVRGLRQGSVCIDLGEQLRIDPELPWPDLDDWYEVVQASVLTTGNGPLRWDLDLLYLDRYWRQEIQVCFDLLARATQPPPPVDPARLTAALDRHFPGPGEQRQAADVAAQRWTTVLGGGPGTGKTTTIARLLAVLLDQPGPPLRVALAAPTGKAAARMQEAVQEVQQQFPAVERDRLGTLTASTLHRLLGSRGGFGTRFTHHHDNRLPFDIIVVDETSMVSLTMMARLLDAVRPQARLILVGDPDQLASVEAGAVLADLVAGLAEREQRTPTATSDGQQGSGVVLLTRIHRFEGGIAQLAHAVRDGDADEALDILLSDLDDVSFVDPDAGDDLHDVRTDVVTSATGLRDAASAGDAVAALHALDRHRVLCAHRTGPYGVEEWSRRIERWLAASRSATHQAEWYLGRPVLVTANDYLLGLYNGDTGVVVAAGGPGGTTGADLRVAFRRHGQVVTFAPSRLAGLQTVHAMTVHRSQGSQFDHVTLVLPEPDSPLLTREMLYTALTRARGHVRLLGTEDAFREAIDRRAARASGLRERLAAGR
ncbi:MAG: exodeoxyribonuclease V subunit alpha [Nakamurella sp.]